MRNSNMWESSETVLYIFNFLKVYCGYLIVMHTLRRHYEHLPFDLEPRQMAKGRH